MGPFLSGFADELVKIGAGDKVVPPMPPVKGGRPKYNAAGSFKPDVPKIEPPGSMKMAVAGGNEAPDTKPPFPIAGKVPEYKASSNVKIELPKASPKKIPWAVASST